MPAPTPTTQELLLRVTKAMGGHEREGQGQMAVAVAGSIQAKRHLLIQAGTGTGKTLAYLVPALTHAVENDERVIVATATLALQRQIMTSDLPATVQALAPALKRTPKAALLKGRSNYLCRYKLDGGYAGEEATLFDVPGASSSPASAMGEQVVRVREWAKDTDSGDRDEMDPGVGDQVWRQFSVSAIECLGSKCPMFAECYAEAARVTASTADLVVTNHSMLAVHSEQRPVLPEYGVLVADEAHELVSRMTSAGTQALSENLIESAARSARRSLHTDVDALQRAGRHLGGALQDVPEGRWKEVVPGEVTDAMAEVAQEAWNALRGSEKGTEDAADGARATARARLTEIAEVAQRISVAGDGDVVWATTATDHPGDVSVRIAPLNVSGLIRANLVGQATMVCTSATLTVGGRFDLVAGDLGLSEGEWDGKDVGSPFNYGKQGILYIAKQLPPPSRQGSSEGAHQEMADLIEASSGGALGLFSSRKAAEEAAEVVRKLVDVPILCQSDGALVPLVRQFAQEPDTCLFGTISLWQGIDVPGPSCRLVLIDRIPFPRPDDPVLAARKDAADRAGGNGFMSVYAAHAALMLAQGAGRLIRSASDRGAVAVLDSRLATARYASFLRAGMPSMWPTGDPEKIRGALRRLASAK